MEQNNNTCVVIGDASIDCYMEPRGSAVRTHDLEGTKYLCLPFAEKSAAENAFFSVGGGATNVAIALSRLGVQTEVLTSVTKDPLGDLVVSELQHEHVDVDHIERQTHTTMNMSVILLTQGERTLCTYHAPVTHTLHVAPVGNIFLTSIGNNFSSVMTILKGWMQNTKRLLFFNPGSQQVRDGIASFVDLLPLTSVFFINKAEALAITNAKPDSSMESLLTSIHKHGVKIVVITDAEHGADAYDGTTLYHVDAIATSIVDTTGAGDAFNSAFAAAYCYGNDIKTCLHWGTKNAASVIAVLGAHPGLVEKKNIE